MTTSPVILLAGADDKVDSDVSTNKENLGHAGNTQSGLNNNNKIKSDPQSPVRSAGRTETNCKSPGDPSTGQESPTVVVKQEEHPTKYPVSIN